MATRQTSQGGDPGPIAYAKQVFRMLRQSGYPGVYRRVPITHELVHDLATLSAHIGRVGSVAEAVLKDGGIEWEDLPETDPPEVLESAFCQLAGRHLGGTVFFDERLVAEVYDAIAEVHYRFFLEHLLQSEPVSAMEFHNRGNARCDTGDHAGAIADYTEAIGLEPAEPRYYISRARCLLEDQNDPLSAALDTRMATDLADPAQDPSVLDLPILRARVMLAQGKTIQSIRALVEFVRDAGLVVSAADWNGEGSGELKNGAPVDAAAVLDCIGEAVEVLEALPAEDDVRMLEKLLRNLAAKL